MRSHYVCYVTVSHNENTIYNISAIKQKTWHNATAGRGKGVRTAIYPQAETCKKKKKSQLCFTGLRQPETSKSVGSTQPLTLVFSAVQHWSKRLKTKRFKMAKLAQSTMPVTRKATPSCPASESNPLCQPYQTPSPLRGNLFTGHALASRNQSRLAIPLWNR